MAIFHSLTLLQFLVLGCSLWSLVFAGKIEMGGFHNDFGSTGCVNDPTRKCINGKKGDVCYGDRGLSFAISGTAPTCNACMPYNHRNIASYQDPHDLPCALWRYYECDDVFVSHVWYKAQSGNNVCIEGSKSYNMNNWFGDAKQNEEEFIKACRTEQPGAFYGWPPVMKLITEKEFCLPLRDNITISDQSNALSDYKEYYDNKYMK